MYVYMCKIFIDLVISATRYGNNKLIMTMLFIGNGLEMYFTYVSLHIYKDVLITFGINPDHRPNKAYHFICLNKPN